MIRATRKNTQSCVMISITSFLVGKRIRDIRSGEKLAWNKGQMRKAFKGKGATGTVMGRWDHVTTSEARSEERRVAKASQGQCTWAAAVRRPSWRPGRS